MTDPRLSEFAVDNWVTFAPYGWLHLVTVCVCALAIVGLAAAGRALRGRNEAALRRALGIFGILYWVSYNVWWNRDGLVPASGLPLHLCDLNGLIAPLALLTLNRWLRATLYFWTFALTIQAYIQPDLTHGPATAVFWFFWAQHAIILAYAVYDLVVLRFRPDWRDLGRAYVVSLIYLATVLPVNLYAGLELRLHRRSAAAGAIASVRGGARALAATRAHHRDARRGGLCAPGVALAAIGTAIETAEIGVSECRRFEVPATLAANSFRNFKSKSGTRIVSLAGFP